MCPWTRNPRVKLSLSPFLLHPRRLQEKILEKRSAESNQCKKQKRRHESVKELYKSRFYTSFRCITDFENDAGREYVESWSKTTRRRKIACQQVATRASNLRCISDSPNTGITQGKNCLRACFTCILGILHHDVTQNRKIAIRILVNVDVVRSQYSPFLPGETPIAT